MRGQAVTTYSRMDRKYRVVAVTDQRIVVYAANPLSPSLARREVGTLDRRTELTRRGPGGPLVLSGPNLPEQRLYFRPGRSRPSTAFTAQ